MKLVAKIILSDDEERVIERLKATCKDYCNTVESSDCRECPFSVSVNNGKDIICAYNAFFTTLENVTG